MYKLFNDPLEYATYHKKTYDTRAKVYHSLFIVFNVLSLLATLATSAITTLMISKLIWTSWPDWYFFFSTGASALIALFTSILNFFVVKVRYRDMKIKSDLISQEIILFSNKMTYKYARKDRRDFYLFNSISRIVGSEAAQKVGAYED